MSGRYFYNTDVFNEKPIRPTFLNFIANIFNVKAIFDKYWYLIRSTSNKCNIGGILGPNIANIHFLFIVNKHILANLLNDLLHIGQKFILFLKCQQYALEIVFVFRIIFKS